MFYPKYLKSYILENLKSSKRWYINIFQVMEDPLQKSRLDYIIDDCEIEVGDKSKEGDVTESLKVYGLLALVKNNQISDSRRSYQCIKTLVTAANKSLVVKEKLLRDPEKWQWAVNWLKDKMSQGNSHSSGNSDASCATDNSNYWNSATDGLGSLDVISNDDATSTRIFHRTTSAQVILEEANALLAEFGDTSMNENENSPSMSSNSSKNSSGLQPSEKGNETSPSSSTSFNRQMAVVPDIDKNEKSSLLDHMETDK